MFFSLHDSVASWCSAPVLLFRNTRHRTQSSIWIEELWGKQKRIYRVRKEGSNGYIHSISRLKSISMETNWGCVLWLWSSCNEKTIFMHDPISPRIIWRLPSIENQCLLHPHQLTIPWRCDLFVCATRLPVPRTCCSIAPVSNLILGFLVTEKVLLLLQITWTQKTHLSEPSHYKGLSSIFICINAVHAAK